MPAKPMVDSAVYVNRIASHCESIVISLEYRNTGIQEDRKTGDRTKCQVGDILLLAEQMSRRLCETRAHIDEIGPGTWFWPLGFVCQDQARA